MARVGMLVWVLYSSRQDRHRLRTRAAVKFQEVGAMVAQRTERRRQEGSSNSAALAFDGGATLVLGRIGVRASAGYARFFPRADFAVDVNAFRRRPDGVSCEPRSALQ